MRSLLAATVFIGLTSCALMTTKYYNSRIPNGSVQQQLEIDNGYCVSASVGSVPMPEIRQYNTGQERYSIRGTTTSYSPKNGYTDYTYNAQVSPIVSPVNAFANGFANGASIAAVGEARGQRENVYNGCMASLGWSREPSKSSAAIDDVKLKYSIGARPKALAQGTNNTVGAAWGQIDLETATNMAIKFCTDQGGIKCMIVEQQTR